MHTTTFVIPVLCVLLIGCAQTTSNVRAGLGPGVVQDAEPSVASEIELLEIDQDLERWRAQLTETLLDAARLHAMVHAPGGSLVGSGDLSRPTLRRRQAEAQNKASVLEAKISAADARWRELRADLRASD